MYKWDIIVTSPLYLGSFVETNAIEPLDGYFNNLTSTERKNYLDGIIPILKKSYTRVDNKNYGIILDGDVLQLHYRPSYFKDKNLPEKYFKQYHKELIVPAIWQEYDEISSSFTTELK